MIITEYVEINIVEKFEIQNTFAAGFNRFSVRNNFHGCFIFEDEYEMKRRFYQGASLLFLVMA